MNIQQHDDYEETNLISQRGDSGRRKATNKKRAEGSKVTCTRILGGNICRYWDWWILILILILKTISIKNYQRQVVNRKNQRDKHSIS